MTLTDRCLSRAGQCTERDAPDTFSEVGVLRLTKHDQEFFLAAIANPPEPAPALIRAVERYRRLLVTDA